MKNWIFIFMISMITLPGYGKVKVVDLQELR